MAKTLTQRIELKFNIPMLDRVIIAVLTSLSNKKFIKNVKELFSNITNESYQTDFEKQYRVYLIRKFVELILDKNLNTKEELLSEVNLDGKFYNECVSLLNELHDAYLSPEELATVDETISSQLKYGVIEKKADELIDLVNIIKAEAYDDFDEEMGKLENIVSSLSNDFHSVKESIEETKFDVNLSDILLVSKLQEIIDDENNPSSKIKTGIQALNSMLNGGFEAERLYCLMAVAKGFKSGLMLNIAMWAKKYNKIKPKDPNKKPVVVYLSMENTIKETLKRTCVYEFGNNFKASNYTANQIHEMLSSTVASPEGCSIEMLYRPDKSISTADLDGILDDLEKDGKECVMLILDYLNRIRSANSKKGSEMRFELSDISNELASIAKTRSIPVITATQLNREAFKILEDADSYEEKVAAAGKLGASHIGEAIAIVQNVDMAVTLARLNNTKCNENGEIEYDDKFLLMKCIASRGNTPTVNNFQIRFATVNDLRLIEDINEKQSLATFTTEQHIGERTTNRPRSSVRRI